MYVIMLFDVVCDKEYVQIKVDVDMVVMLCVVYWKGCVEKVWLLYVEKFDMKVYEIFKKNFESLQDEVMVLIEECIVDMFVWMQFWYFLDGLWEYYGDDIQDVVVFELYVSEVMFLLNMIKSGCGKIEEWVNDLQIVEFNLMYCLLSMNQDVV